MKKWILLALAMTVTAQAGIFKITCTGCNAAAQAAATELENQVNADLPDADASTYLKGMANGSVASAKGIGNDYSNDLDFMMVSANVGVGVDTGNKELTDFVSGDADESQVRGVGLNAALTVGLDLGILPVDKLGPIDLEKTDLFLSFMKYDKGSEGVDDVTAEMKYVGIKARYHWKEGKAILPGGLLKWGGLFITTGIEKSNLRMVLKETSSETDATTGSTITGDATFGADISTTSIPLEISTYIQTLYALTFFGGLGLDYNMGDAKAIANANMNVTFSGAATGTGNGSLDLGQEGEPESTSFRGFLGLQVGVPLVKFYVQMNKQFTGDNVGQVAAGLKVVW